MRRDPQPRKVRGHLLEIVRDERGVIERAGAGCALGNRDPGWSRGGVVARPLGDVHTRHTAGVKPVACKGERRARPDRESQGVAVEVARRVYVIGKHQEVLEMRD